MKDFLLRSWLITIIISGLCLADEFHSTTITIPIYSQQSIAQQSKFIPSCQAYKHRNNAYFGENLHSYAVTQLQHYFKKQNYSEQQILDQELLYLFNEFVKLAKTYMGYEVAIEKLHEKFKKFGPIKKFLHTLAGSYSSGLKLRIDRLHKEIQLKKKYEEKHKSKPKLKQKSHHSLCFSEAQIDEYKNLQSVYDEFSPLLAGAIEKRIQVDNQIVNDKAHFSTKTYQLNEDMMQLLCNNGIASDEFMQCAGNQLQHVLHEESITILEHITSLPTYSVLYAHQNAVAEFTTALCRYNKEGLIDKASIIADFCWTLLDYGQAIAEGAALGLYATAQDLVTNPLEVTVCIVAGKQVLTYHLCKVLYNVADIGITAISDYDRAKEKWNDYLTPINSFIAAIEKKEITVRDSLKMGTAFAVGYKAQSKLLGGLGKFFTMIKQSAIRFTQNSISSFTIQQYLSTPEGYLLRSASKSCRSANCPNQYTHLTQWLKIKEFTSIIDTTKHGIERLIERGFTSADVLEVMKFPSFMKIQRDGALVYIRQIQNNFNVIVLNQQTKKVATAIKNIDQKSLDDLGKNYGWKKYR